MWVFAILVLALAGCASPAPEFIGAPMTRLRVDGHDFVVFQRGQEAEVIRMGYLHRRARDAIPMLMYRAAEEASGCVAVPGSLRSRLPGDTGEGRIALRC